MSAPRKNSDRGITGSYIEQSMKIISEPPGAPVLIYPISGDKHSKEELKLKSRLDKLREQPAKMPSEDELAARLTKLQDRTPDLAPSKTKTSAGIPESELLIRQAQEEACLEARAPKPEDEISARLVNLRGKKVSPDITPPVTAQSIQPPIVVQTTSDTADSEVEALMNSMKLEVAADQEHAGFMERLQCLDGITPPDRVSPYAWSTSSDEMYSNDEYDDAMDTGEVDQEVQRVINMYAGSKSKKKKPKSKQGKKPTESDTDSDIETSDSEKNSDSD